jgi:hypothetical protein
MACPDEVKACALEKGLWIAGYDNCLLMWLVQMVRQALPGRHQLNLP